MNDSQMRDNGSALEALLRADLPPKRDPLFRLAVLARRERRELQRRIATAAAFGAATALVAFNAAAIGDWLAEDMSRLAGVVAAAAGAVWMLPDASRVVPSPLRNLARI